MLRTGVSLLYKRAFPYHMGCMIHTNTIPVKLEDNQLNYRTIKESYSGKSIFVTGGTGFLGKVLIEKLLRSTDVEKIYVLIREKKGIDSDKRLKQMLNIPIFEELKETKPDALNKIVAVGGDVTKKNLGLSAEDEGKIIENVSIVFHSAATVKFIDPFADIMNINYEGTKKVVNLSKKIKNLETFVHISTAYCQGDKLQIQETLYPRVYEESDVYKFIETYGDNPKEIVRFLEGSPNTYGLSKCLSESYIEEEHEPVSTIIVRPSIVTPVYKEPVPGWVDSWVAAIALFSDVARGLTKVMYGNENVICDMIPVDYVINLAIVAAARGNKTKDILVFNCSSGTANAITWKQGADIYLEESLKYGKSGLKPSYVKTFTSTGLVNLLSFALETTPAFISDLKLRIKGEPPKYLNMEKRANLLRDILKTFTNTSYQIETKRTESLFTTLSKEDKVQFPFDPKTIIWRKYMKVFYRGVQKYMLNDK